MEASVAGLVDPDARGRAVGIAVRSRAEAEFRVAASKSEPTFHKMFLYFGPNEPAVMTKELGAKADAWGGVLSKVHSEDLGFFGVFARAILAVLNLFHGLTQSWGWSIVLLTITVRLVLFPINRKSQISMLRHSEVMARIKPEIDKLREKYSNDPRALMAEQSKLMKANGVGMMPIGGCLPLFLQLPVFYGLFSGLRSELALRQASFLWAKDLSQPDHLVTFTTPVTNPLVSLGSCCLPPGSSETISGLHLLPLLMMVAWFLNSWLQPRPTVTSPEAETQRKMMMFMPVLFGVMMYGYAAGLSLYWLVSSLVGIIESKVIKRSIAAAQPAAVATKSTRG
jgi:YidC/Oxa1 family membrane protein insertase